MNVVSLPKILFEEQSYISGYHNLLIHKFLCKKHKLQKYKKILLRFYTSKQNATFSIQVRENIIAKCVVVVFNKKNETIIRFPQVQEEFREASKFITN